MRTELSPAHFRVVYLAMVTLGPHDFMRQLCRALGVEAKATVAAAFHAIQAQLHGDHRIHPVLLMDECCHWSTRRAWRLSNRHIRLVLGDGLRARRPEAQTREAMIAVSVLNRMRELGVPESVAAV